MGRDEGSYSHPLSYQCVYWFPEYWVVEWGGGEGFIGWGERVTFSPESLSNEVVQL